MKIFLLIMGAGCISLIIFLVMERGIPLKTDPVKPAGEDKRPMDYDVYIMAPQERMLYVAAAAAALAFLAYIFYHSYMMSLLVTPLACFYPRIRTRDIISQRKRELNLQFKEALYSLSSSLSAGKSMESALKDVLKDLSLIYPDPDTYILREFQYIVRKTDMNETVEDALADFSRRAHLEDIASFSEVLNICKRTGGNMVEVIKNTSTIIAEKLQVKQEIETLLAQRKFEQKVLNLMPPAMITILSWSTGDYMDPVFHTMAGRSIMTIAILLLAVAYAVSAKVMKIEV